MTWDTEINNDFWGSILDDLPSELSGNESENEPTNLSDEPLNWTNQLVDSHPQLPTDDNLLKASDPNNLIDNLNSKFIGYINWTLCYF